MQVALAKVTPAHTGRAQISTGYENPRCSLVPGGAGGGPCRVSRAGAPAGLLQAHSPGPSSGTLHPTLSAFCAG